MIIFSFRCFCHCFAFLLTLFFNHFICVIYSDHSFYPTPPDLPNCFYFLITCVNLLHRFLCHVCVFGGFCNPLRLTRTTSATTDMKLSNRAWQALRWVHIWRTPHSQNCSIPIVQEGWVESHEPFSDPSLTAHRSSHVQATMGNLLSLWVPDCNGCVVPRR